MKQVRRRRRWLIVLATMPVVYFAMAYVLLPALWRLHEHEPGLAVLPMVTRTGSGIPGDALNVGLVGSKEDILRAMQAAGWFPADPITLRVRSEHDGTARSNTGCDHAIDLSQRDIWLGPCRAMLNWNARALQTYRVARPILGNEET